MYIYVYIYIYIYIYIYVTDISYNIIYHAILFIHYNEQNQF